MTVRNCVFDGAIDGWWSDDARTQNGGTFGGSMTKFTDTVFYDFAGRAMRHDGLRTRQGLQIHNTAVNPISVNCVRGIDLTNIDGLTLSGGGFAPSTSGHATTEWLRLSNTTGSVYNVFFDDLSKAGTLDGVLNVRGNRIYGTDGFTLIGGVITGGANEFGKGAAGWTLAPAYQLAADIGPDLFKPSVTRSYDIPADSSILSARIGYDSANDASTSRFRNTSSRVRIENIDRKQIAIADAVYAISVSDTGRTILASGAVAQAFTLPTPVPGTSITITKISAQNLTLTCAAGSNFYGTGSAYPSSESLAGASMGTLVLEAYATVGWIVKSIVGTWSFA
jgi:hypothetical protein